MAHGPQPRALSVALPLAQAATWAWARKVASRPRPPGPKVGPMNLDRQISSDGRARGSGEQNPGDGVVTPNPNAFSSFPFSLSHAVHRASEVVERAAMASSLAPSPACALPNE